MSDKKRILIITNRFHPQIGGAELNIFFQARELSKHFEVDVMTPIRDCNPHSERAGSFHISRCYNMFNPFNRFPYLPAKTLCPGILTRVFFRKYDLIHCFPALGHNNILALKIAGLKQIPVFLSNFDLFDYATLLAQGVAVSEFSELQMPLRSKARLARFNAIFTISQKETEIIRAVNPNTFLSTVPIDLDEYGRTHDLVELRQRFSIDPRRKVVLCLSRVCPIKGQDILMDALPLLKSRFENFVAVFAGRTDYEDEYAARMKSFVSENGLDRNVVFTGSLSREDVLGLLSLCDVHVLPMRFMNSGAINTETWMSGRPIIQSGRVDPNYVEDGVNGFNFDIEDKEGLVEKLVRVLEDEVLATRMGENGRKLAMEKFTYPALIAQYLEVYRQCGGIEP